MINPSNSTRGILQAYQYLNELSDSITKTRGTDHTVLPAAHRHIGYIQGVLMVIFLERKYDDERLSKVMKDILPPGDEAIFGEGFGAVATDPMKPGAV